MPYTAHDVGIVGFFGTRAGRDWRSEHEGQANEVGDREDARRQRNGNSAPPQPYLAAAVRVPTKSNRSSAPMEASGTIGAWLRMAARMNPYRWPQRRR